MKLNKSAVRLYAVSDRQWSKSKEDFLLRSEQIIKSGITMFQLREKNTEYEEFKELALRLMPVCKKHGVYFIINDNVRLAAEIGADGVHIGQDDTDISTAREILGKDKIIGVSAHNAMEAVKAERGGADYLGSGAAFGSATKTDAGAITFDTLKEVAHSVSIPVAAIGGINAENAIRLQGLGLDGICVVSALFAAENPAEATRILRKTADIIADNKEDF